MKEYLSKLKGKFKALWESFKYWLVKRLGGYAFPPVEPEIKADKVETIKIGASTVVNRKEYNENAAYREETLDYLVRFLVDEMINNSLLPAVKTCDFDDDASIIKISVTLVKGGQ